MSLTIDFTAMPIEIWCDVLEDDGITTEDVRLLFEVVTPQIDIRPNYPETFGNLSWEGEGRVAMYHGCNSFGNGERGRHDAFERGSGWLYILGDGGYYGYRPNNR